MAHYAGVKALDAEITLDFDTKKVTMDYSLNKFGSPYSSNNTTVLHSTFKHAPLRERLVERVKCAGYFALAIPVLTCSPIHTFLSVHNILNNAWVDYNYQKLLKNILVMTEGLSEQRKTGELFESKLTFSMPHNLWFEYELDGEYQDKIKSISLKRKFITRYTYGKYPHQRQVGWNVIFEFTEPPKSGSCILRST
jgi:hypothetical protein